MPFNKKSSFKKLIILLLTPILLIGVFFFFVSDYYRADESSINEYIKDMNVNKLELYDGVFAYESSDSDIGFIFYPGGKVEFTSYEPLMYELASNCITCILIEMPFNLAFFNANAATKAMDYYPNISNWYIGGHSLGGSIASTYLETNSGLFKGLVLLASYSTSDLSYQGLDIISIYGSEDQVLNKKNYDKCKENLPSSLKEVVIEGGNHSYFGMYGKQDKDGEALILNEVQISLTANYIYEFMMG